MPADGASAGNRERVGQAGNTRPSKRIRLNRDSEVP